MLLQHFPFNVTFFIHTLPAPDFKTFGIVKKMMELILLPNGNTRPYSRLCRLCPMQLHTSFWEITVCDRRFAILEELYTSLEVIYHFTKFYSAGFMQMNRLTSMLHSSATHRNREFIYTQFFSFLLRLEFEVGFHLVKDIRSPDTHSQ